MAISPTQRPDNGGIVAGTDASSAWSGTPDRNADPTNLTGQYPPGSWGNALFGGPQPMGSGAPGTQGARYTSASDPTNQPGQLYEGLSGLGPADTADSGAPGMTTAPNTVGGGATIAYTIPGAGSSGTHHQAMVRDDLAGSRDSTQANDEGYASGGPQLPGIAGNEPSAAGGYGSWQPDLNGTPHVMRGGRDIKPGRSSNR